MNIDSRQAIELLDTLGNCSAKLIDLSFALRSRSDVLQVQNDLTCRKYQTGSMIEGYVDVELRSGENLCWSLEVSWEEKWLIDTRILLTTVQGQDTLYNFRERTTTDLDEFILQIAEAVQELVEFDAFKLLVKK